MSFTEEMKDVLVLFKDNVKGLRTLNIHRSLLNSFIEELPSLRFLKEINLWCIDYEDFNKLDNVSSIRLEVDELTKLKYDSEFDYLSIEQGEKLLDYYKRLYSHAVKEFKKKEAVYYSNLGNFAEEESDKYVIGSRMLVSPDNNPYSRETNPSSIVIELRVSSFDRDNSLSIGIYDYISESVRGEVRAFIRNYNQEIDSGY